jgi:hypothetical protein
VAAYILVAIFTFGYAAIHHKCFNSDEKPKACHPDDAAMLGGYPAAIAWPLYWSWKAQEQFQ